MIPTILKAFLPALVAFLVGFAIVPILTNWMYSNRLWKRLNRDEDNQVAISEAYKKVMNREGEIKTPRVGGTVVWVGTLVTGLLFVFMLFVGPSRLTFELDFISKSQTLLPFIALIFGGLFGLFEDFVEIFAHKFPKLRHGLDDKYLIAGVILFAGACATWFFVKLGYHEIHIPFAGLVNIGWFFIPYFMLVMLGTFSSRIIDGIDGLAGGVIAVSYSAFGVIAIMQGQFDIAAFCFVVTATLLVFLWFNIPPARFYLGETGMMGLTLALPIVAFLLNKSLWILIISFPLAATAASGALQIFWKRYFKRKLFRIAPLHHHFEALGWGKEKVVMRYWLLSIMVAVVGIILAMIG